jgi:hypothetical protein
MLVSSDAIKKYALSDHVFNDLFWEVGNGP